MAVSYTEAILAEMLTFTLAVKPLLLLIRSGLVAGDHLSLCTRLTSTRKHPRVVCMFHKACCNAPASNHMLIQIEMQQMMQGWTAHSSNSSHTHTRNSIHFLK